MKPILPTQTGFTLVEVTLVMAIASFLAIIAWQGFHSLQRRQRFDAAVNKTIADIAFVRNSAVAKVNDMGLGNSTDTFMVGDSFELNNDHYDGDHPLGEMQPIYAPNLDGQPDYTNLAELPFGSDTSQCLPGASSDGDECWERYLESGDDLIITSPGTRMTIGYLPKESGLEVCQAIDDTDVSIPTACSNIGGADFTFTLADSAGLTATIGVSGKSGYARRID